MTTRSRSELVAALPEVRRLLDQLTETTKPAWTLEEMAPETEALYYALGAAGWLADSLDAEDPAKRAERLIAAAERMEHFTQAAHKRVAELRSMDELAAEEEERRGLNLDTSAIIYRAELKVGLPDATDTTITVTVADGGRVAWESPTLDLAPVDGVAQLAVANALTQLAEALTKALPDAVLESQD
jgi:hypothetical protein